MITKYEIRFFRVGTASKGGDAIFIRLYDEHDHLSHFANSINMSRREYKQMFLNNIVNLICYSPGI